jgi:hypothetical protein
MWIDVNYEIIGVNRNETFSIIVNLSIHFGLRKQLSLPMPKPRKLG